MSEADLLNRDWAKREAGGSSMPETRVVESVATHTEEDDRLAARETQARLEQALGSFTAWALTPTERMREQGRFFGND